MQQIWHRLIAKIKPRTSRRLISGIGRKDRLRTQSKNIRINSNETINKITN